MSEEKCPDCGNIMVKMKKPPFRKRYFYKYQFQGHWYACMTCYHIWTQRGLKRLKK